MQNDLDKIIQVVISYLKKESYIIYSFAHCKAQWLSGFRACIWLAFVWRIRTVV
jgi:hypothetical protein